MIRTHVAFGARRQPAGARPVIDPHRDGLLLGELLRVLEQDPLELVLAPRLEQPLPQVHVREERGERPARLQRVLRALLDCQSAPERKGKNIRRVSRAGARFDGRLAGRRERT